MGCSVEQTARPHKQHADQADCGQNAAHRPANAEPAEPLTRSTAEPPGKSAGEPPPAETLRVRLGEREIARSRWHRQEPRGVGDRTQVGEERGALLAGGDLVEGKLAVTLRHVAAVQAGDKQLVVSLVTDKWGLLIHVPQTTSTTEQFHIPLEPAAQGETAAMDARLHGAERDAHQAGDLGVVVALDVEEHDAGALLLR